jgi:hypothetical protein
MLTDRLHHDAVVSERGALTAVQGAYLLHAVGLGHPSPSPAVFSYIRSNIELHWMTRTLLSLLLAKYPDPMTAPIQDTSHCPQMLACLVPPILDMFPAPVAASSGAMQGASCYRSIDHGRPHGRHLHGCDMQMPTDGS